MRYMYTYICAPCVHQVIKLQLTYRFSMTSIGTLGSSTATIRLHVKMLNTYLINYSFYLLVFSHVLFVFTPIVLQKDSYFIDVIWIYLRILAPKCLTWFLYKMIFVIYNDTGMGATLVRRNCLHCENTRVHRRVYGMFVLLNV